MVEGLPKINEPLGQGIGGFDVQCGSGAGCRQFCGRGRSASADVPLQTSPTSAFWSAARPAYLEKEENGKLTSHFRSQVRTRWTKDNLYFDPICPTHELYLKPSATIMEETNELWNWDVAEVFISSDFSDIKRYQEFEVSPQGEWIDLAFTVASRTTKTGGPGTLDLR